MPITNKGLLEELNHISKQDELQHITKMLEKTDALMQQVSYALICGDNETVDRLTKQALDENYEANTILDDGLIAGMAIVGIKFRDNIIFVPEVLISARAMKAETFMILAKTFV